MTLAHRAQPSSVPLTPDEIIHDYRLGYLSRQVSLIGRREVLSGKAKFGIFGDGKETPQLALARAFRPGDWRSGYYRDQTFMFAVGAHTPREFFAQLYAHADPEADPATAGRSMNAHFATRQLNPDGSWRDQTDRPNAAADVSPTGAQLPRLVGLGYASRLYRELPALQQFPQFSNAGDEIAFGTIGNATCAEGLFWESINAIGVLRAPVILSIWDDEYGISVHNEHQMVKQDLSALLSGFQRAPGEREGFDLYRVRGWDYPALVRTYLQAAAQVRAEHIPAIIHVVELTQPQGHSTSGSHERYKTAGRLEWERQHDCLTYFRDWLLEQGVASEPELQAWEAEDRQAAEQARRAAWEACLNPVRQEARGLAAGLDDLAAASPEHAAELVRIKTRFASLPVPLRRDLAAAAHAGLLLTRSQASPARKNLLDWRADFEAAQGERYHSQLHNPGSSSALNVPAVPALYSEASPSVHGFELLNQCFDRMLTRDPRVVAFGEDVGRLGDVNQGFAGLQAKHGVLRVSDTGIREATILGQAIGLALRGLRPIAEIQYLDYILYALQIMSDDLATLRWRTRGGQAAPVIVRTRGHRLEGIWHSGSPMASLIHLVRGLHVLVPRNMTQAAGFYNTLLKSDDPAVVVEVLNGYRLKETLPDNLGEFCLPLGVPEVLRPGNDVTLVTYGACCRLALEAAERLAQVGIDVEVIDVQSLLPFDRPGRIGESLRKTSRILFVDEDVPGGATAYMLQEVLERQGGYYHLDAAPRTLSGQPHRPAYGSDGDYWSKPNVETIFDAAYELARA